MIKSRHLLKLRLSAKPYVEPFAGGFGVGLALLCENVVERAVLNDLDSHIYNFWYSVFNHTDELTKKILDTAITIKERENQKSIYVSNSLDVLADGFATLYLNRVNFSGIIKGGPIGGYTQSGQYKLDYRFDKKEIARK